MGRWQAGSMGGCEDERTGSRREEEGWRGEADKAVYHDSLERVCPRQTPSRSPSPGRRYIKVTAMHHFLAWRKTIFATLGGDSRHRGKHLQMPLNECVGHKLGFYSTTTAPRLLDAAKLGDGFTTRASFTPVYRCRMPETFPLPHWHPILGVKMEHWKPWPGCGE